MLNPSFRISHWNDVRDVAVPGDTKKTLTFCLEHLLDAYASSVKDHGAFYMALSGGSTPKTIFEMLTASPYKEKIDWSKVHLFWSDERSVPKDHPESNYHMAMQAGFAKMPLLPGQVHRMIAEEKIEQHAAEYEKIITAELGDRPFDYMMLGMGEDGHTASLFPHTAALGEEHKLVVANWVPQKNTWRMTFTYPCINRAKHIVIYVMGSSKKEMLRKVLSDEGHFVDLPITKIGTKGHKALWICDSAAAESIRERISSL